MISINILLTIGIMNTVTSNRLFDNRRMEMGIRTIMRMERYTLTLVFNKTCDKVLMCYHEKQGLYNFVGGHIEDGEDNKAASYRELFEETGISKDDITLIPVREETVYANSRLYTHDWFMYITYGVLENDVCLVQEKNHLVWIDVNDPCISLCSMGNGNCRVFLNEALILLRIDR